MDDLDIKLNSQLVLDPTVFIKKFIFEYMKDPFKLDCIIFKFVVKNFSEFLE
jgi:hypothetical protein